MAKLGRLSLGERVLLALAAIVVAFNFFFWFAARGEGEELAQLRTKVSQARLTLEEVRRQADPKPLETEKAELVQALEALVYRVEVSEPALRLWEWAAQSGVELVAMNHSSAPVQIEGVTFLALKYHIVSRGERAGLAQFLALIATSPYLPVVDNLDLSLGEEGDWEMKVDLLIYSEGEGGPEAA